MKKILFVCMGNICRSPTAQGVFEYAIEKRGLTAQFECDSAGTHAYHQGQPPDRRATAAGADRGIDIGDQRARQIAQQDFLSFDIILAMDSSNLADLRDVCPVHLASKLQLMLDIDGIEQHDVPDPYYGGDQGFENVLDLLEQAVELRINQWGEA